jgi:hypothetical protein
MKFEYRILMDLLDCLPKLESLECCIGGEEWTPGYVDNPAKIFPWDYAGVRRDRRHSLFKAISAIDIPKSLQKISLDFIPFAQCGPAEERLPHYRVQPNLVSPAESDPFSTSLRILLYNLKEMILHAQVDESLFWSEDDSTSIWPHLQRLFLGFHIVKPSGTWYFEGPRGISRLRSRRVCVSSGIL